MKALAYEAINTYRLSAAQVGNAGNVMLGFWIESVCCIKSDGLKAVAELLTLEYKSLNFTADYARALKLLLMLGCHSRGQPTIEELCDLKMVQCTKNFSKGEGADKNANFAGPFQYFNQVT